MVRAASPPTQQLAHKTRSLYSALSQNSALLAEACGPAPPRSARRYAHQQTTVLLLTKSGPYHERGWTAYATRSNLGNACVAI